MAKKPYKYRQARKDAKAAAKKAFPGKVKAVRKDITGKITAEDRMALKDMADTAKKELGKKAYLSRAEYDAMQNKELEKFRQSMADEFGEYGGKKAGGDVVEAEKKPTVKKSGTAKVTDKRTPIEKEASKKAAKKTVKKNTKKFVQKGSPKVVDTPVTPGGELEKKLKTGKKMTRAEKSAANKKLWAEMTPAERKNWKVSKAKAGTAKPKVKKPVTTASTPEPKPAKEPKAPKRPTLADLKKNEAKGLAEAKKRVEAKKAAATKPRIKVTVDGKTSTPTKPTAGQTALKDIEAKAKAKAAKPKFRKIKGAGKAGLYGALAGEVVSLVKGSTKKDFNEINRLENKLAGLTGKTKSAATAGRQGGQQQLSQLASLATMGIVGKTRRQRMDELNNLIAKAEAKKAKANKGLRYGPGGESLVPGTKAYAKGSKTRPATGGTSVGAGGSTTAPTTSSKYTVKKGDTFSGIAKTAGVSLSELRAANPSIMKNKKYKQGSMIWSGTKVNIPKK